MLGSPISPPDDDVNGAVLASPNRPPDGAGAVLPPNSPPDDNGAVAALEGDDTMLIVWC